MSKEYTDPMDYLLDFMNDNNQPGELRLEAAVTLMPYFHAQLEPIEPGEDNE